MSTSKRWISLMLVLCMVLSMVPVTVRAASSGTCGENLTWTLSDDGVLTISGTGEMDHYAGSPAKRPPWYNRINYIYSVVIEDGVNGIGSFALGFANNLQNVSIPDTVTSIGENAFCYCYDLSRVVIPSSVTVMGGCVFDNCYNLNTVGPIGGGYDIEIGWTDMIPNHAFSGYSNLSSVSIPEGIATIGSSAFWGCKNLTNVDIPNSVTTIGDRSFYDCDKLTIVDIPDSVITIGEDAFYDCGQLTNVKIGNSVTTIGESAFSYCESLMGVDMPDSVTSLGTYVFRNCSSLLYAGIGDYIESIPQNTFDGCVSLADVVIGNNVTVIGDSAFNNCDGLISIDITDSVTSIGEQAFYDCDNLLSLEISDNIETIGNKAFASCASLTGIYVDVSNPGYSSDDRGVLFDKTKTMLIQAPGGIAGSYAIPESVQSIGAYSFNNCTNLTSLNIPDSVATIGENAFSLSKSLENVKLGNSITEIGDFAFSSCKSLSSIAIPDTVTSIGRGAFSGCSQLSQITFCGDAPRFRSKWGSYGTFTNVTAVAYYPANNPTWVADKLQNYDGTITWKRYNPNVEITTSIQDYSDDDIIRIRPSELDSLWTVFTPLSGVTVTSGIGEINPTDGEYIIHHADASAQEMILSKDGYRDYILPAEVSKTMRGKEGTAYKLTAYMQKDSKDAKPYISTVFGRESSSDKIYTDLRVASLTAWEDSGCDVIVTVVGFGDQSVTYYLAQDSKRKVSSSTGVFTNKQLYDIFDDTSTVYAYAVASDGTRTEPVAIKVDRKEKLDLGKELGIDSEISLFGKDFFKIKISDDIPVLGGMELDMSAFTVPAGVSVVGDEIKISLGVDLFSSTDSDEGYKWKTFKDMVVTDDDIDLKKIETFCNVYDLAEGHSWKKSNTANKFNVNVLGFVEGKCIDGEFVIKEGEINLGGNFKFQYNAQGAVWVVPVYGTVEAGADFDVGGKMTRFLPDREIPFEFTMLLDVAPKVKGGAGAGIKGAASAGLYAEGKMPLMIAFQEEHFTLDLEGEIGVEGELFLLHGQKALLDGDTNLIDWYYGTSDSPSAVSDVTDQLQTITTVVPRDYTDHTSDWLGDHGPAMSIQSMGTKTTASRGVTFRELQNSIFSNSQPQLVTVGERMLLVWVQDDNARDTYNRMRLVYSVYDPMGDRWSEPQPVWDDGHNDGYPVLVSDGSQAYVLWQKVNTLLTAENTTDIDTTIENSELCLARFDADAGVFADAQMLTGNDLYEYSHNVILENDEPVVYWAAAEENAMDASGTNNLYCWINGIHSVLAQDLNYVLSIDACDGNVTYVADTDGDLSSVEDVTATTISISGTEVFDNSELGTAVTYAGYAPLDGESVLFLSDMQNIYYNYNGEVKSVLEESRTMDGNLNIVETDAGTTIIWTETVDGWNEIYAVVYKDGKWSAPVMISENGELLTRISATSYDGKLYGVCNSNAVAYDEATGEYAKGETNLTLFQTCDFSDIALANYMNINENTLEAGVETSFNVTVYNNGINFVDEVTFTVTDTLGTESVQTVAVAIPSGSSETVMLTYLVPDGYTTTTMTVNADIANDDVKESDNILSRKIGNPDLAVTETAVEVLSDGYKITAIVENGSLVNAENVTLSVFADEANTEFLRSETIGTISRENYAITEILVKEEALNFTENGTAKLYLKLDADGEEASGADNALCIVVSKMAETVCMHPVTEQIAGLEPTCTEPGYEAYEICAACGVVIGEITAIHALGHSHTALVTQPSCTERGYTTYTCSCGDSYIADYVDELGHDMGSWETTVPAICTEDGEEQRTCSRCDHSESRVIESVGHHWDKGVVTREPTEDTEGERLYTCTACGATRTESIPVIGHEHRYEAVVTAPTCTERGYTTYTCKCGESYVADYVDALGHSFSDWTVIQEPTNTEDGLEERSCTRCGHTEQRSITKLENPFSDVVPGSFYYEPVMWAIENGITNGTSATTFGPNDQCMRAHVVTFLWRAVGSPEPTRTDNPFVDVKPSDFYYKPVLWAVENGITSGMDATHFGPAAYCNRAQVVTFLYRTMGSPELESAENPFTDVAKGSFYEKPVLWAVKNGITNGLSATTFGPNTICNRAQIVTFLYRAFVD